MATVVQKHITPVSADTHKTMADTFATLPASGQLGIAYRHGLIDPADGNVNMSDVATQQKILRRIREKGIVDDVINSATLGIRQ